MDARLLTTPSLHPQLNMALDEAVSAEGVTVRLYGFEPGAISLGYFQSASEFPQEWLEERGLVLVRRVTGGAAICHVGDITFSIVARPEHPILAGDVEASYHRIHEAVAAGLAILGVDSARRGDRGVQSDSTRAAEAICFYKATRFDLVAAGRKLVGSAQRRTPHRVLHHGSIPLTKNLLAPNAACVRDLVGRDVGFGEAAAALTQAFRSELRLDLVPAAIESDERLRAEQLVASRFATDEWNRRR